jgi:hypothetical protein
MILEPLVSLPTSHLLKAVSAVTTCWPIDIALDDCSRNGENWQDSRDLYE